MAGPFFTRPNFEDRQMVQYSGRTITLSGDTNINQTGNLRIQKGAFPGLVATSLDSDGTIVWGPISGISWSVSGCTSPLYVNNLVSCPSSGGTIQVDAGNLALNSELNFLISLSAGTNTDEILVIDNNGYVKTVPNLMGIGNMWHIPVGYTLTVPDNYQSFIYGDILIEGTIDLQTNAQLVILNGNLILSGGSIIGSGTTYLVTLGGNGCCFTGTTSGSCLSEICVKQLYSVRDVYIKGLTFGTGGSDIASTGTTYVTNTAGGKDVLLSNTTGYENTGFGSEVLSANTIGYSNTAVGAYALKENVDGYLNTAIGDSSLKANIDGYNNTATGVYTLFSNINGVNNTAIGTSALYNNIDGNSNVAIGVSSLTNNIDGDSNVAIGVNTLSSNTNGYNNTAIGKDSLLSNINGFDNVTLGEGTMINNVSGFENVAIGRSSLFQNNSNFNTSVGFSALYSNVGTQNTGIGHSSLINDSTGNYNTAIGYGSGANNSGDYNTFLGNGADTTNPSLTNATAIGYGALVNQINSMVLGNGIINVGVGTSTPSSTLHLIGLNGFTQLRLQTQYTPTGTTDTNGNEGDVAWDDNFIYIKTSVGWKQTTLSTF